MPGLVMEAAQLRQEFSDAWKVIDSRGANLSSLREVEDENSAIIKDLTNFQSSPTKAWEHRLAKDALTR